MMVYMTHYTETCHIVNRS